jgi:hypothetical protein
MVQVGSGGRAAALLEFVRRNRVDLLERFMLEDIEWALKQKGSVA